MRGAAFLVMYLATATCLGLDILVNDWTEFVVLNVILAVALFVGRESVDKSHKENFDKDFMISGTVFIGLALIGLIMVYVLESYLGIDMINMLHNHEIKLRILMMLVTGLLGYKLGQIKDEMPTEV